ncbi:hypothetical protein TNCV_3755501 [Trichonephila clavipes]|nr:hypothetical protein TNCV_3755501 [Trichonephila clavipes]
MKRQRTNTEQAGRRSDPETSWRRSSTYGGIIRKEPTARTDHGGVGRITEVFSNVLEVLTMAWCLMEFLTKMAVPPDSTTPAVCCSTTSVTSVVWNANSVCRTKVCLLYSD